MPKELWPAWASALTKLATPEDVGLGDTAFRVIGEENSQAFETWHLKLFGKTCRCKFRRAKWNKLYPLKEESESMPQSTKSQFTITFNPDFVILERRVQAPLRDGGGLETKVFQRDDNVAAAVGDYIMSLAPKQDASPAKA